jgi:hypothetical protein
MQSSAEYTFENYKKNCLFIIFHSAKHWIQVIIIFFLISIQIFSELYNQNRNKNCFKVGKVLQNS